MREHLIAEDRAPAGAGAGSRARVDGWNEAFDPDYQPEFDHAAELERLKRERVKARMQQQPGRGF